MTSNAADVPGGKTSLNERTGLVTYKETKDAYAHADGNGAYGTAIGGEGDLVTRGGFDGSGAYGIAVG